jgi:hypothetical protein
MSDKVEIPNEVKSHPDYADGYADAFNEGHFDTDRAGSEPYCYGFEAGDRAIKMFEEAGFSRNGDGVSISFAIGKGA